MSDPNPHERHALTVASHTGGAYIESLAKTDLALFTAQEWATLVARIVNAYEDHLQAAYLNDPPF